MFSWPGINRSVAAVADGAHYAQNVRYAIDGELQRRRGLEYATSHGAVNLINAWDPTNGYQVLLFTDSGTLELVAL